jgi:galactonate dehydratase
VEGAFVDFRERFIGWDAANIEDIYQSAYRHRFYRGGEVLMSALSGLDIALWCVKLAEVSRKPIMLTTLV